jgi:hypothetical protein
MAMKAQSKILEPACSLFEEDLVLYYYGDGTVDERRRVENHMAGCARCRHFLTDLGGLLPQMAKPKEMPPSFWDNYYREMTEKLAAERERKVWWRNWFAPMNMWLVPVCGTAAVAVLAVTLVMGKNNWSSEPKQIEAAIPQEILADSKELEFLNSLDMLEELRTLEQNRGLESQPSTS